MARRAMTRAELRPLTSLRGLAAWMVVLYHVRVAAAPTLGPDVVAVAAKGYLAVDFFFMLSGFVLWLNYAGRLRAGRLREWGDFIIRRLARIWPLHAAMLGVAAALALLLAVTGRDTSDYPLAELPLHLALMQNWGFTSTLSWNDPAWSISCELAAYLLLPGFALLIDWRRVRTPLLFLVILGLALLLHLVFASTGATMLGAHILQLGVPRCLVEFAVGTVLCELWRRWRGQLAVAAGAVATAVAIAPLGLPETFAIPLIFAALLLAAAVTAETPANPLGLRPLHYLGEISYATYLSHVLLFRLFKLAFVTDQWNVGAGAIAAFAAIVLIASILLHHMVERPAQQWILRRWRSRQAHRPSLAAGG
jgi:peptidoglycan/LPS O-acetylase OafA/YrhL